MPIRHLLAFVFIVLAAPFSRGTAQTCQGTAAFQDGRARLSVDDQYNSDFYDVRGAFEYGVPRSFYGGASFDQLHATHGGPSTTGIGANLGYQIHLGDTPFQLCPAVWGRYLPGADPWRLQAAFGATIGYRVRISDWFSLVPAAGVWSITTFSGADKIDLAQGTPGSSASYPGSVPGTSTQISMEIGLVFNKTFAILPGLLVPSESGAKSIYTIGISIHLANAVNR